MTLAAHSTYLAEKLRLSEEQKGLLLHELRNALLPVEIRAPSRGVKRVMALLDAIAKVEGLGATGKYPQGKVSIEDEGELKMAVGMSPDRQKVILDFGKPVAWLGLDRETAESLGLLLLERARGR